MTRALRPTRRSPHAFTVVEMLVVVSILMLLIALLMPALAKTRSIARTVFCSSNLRQIGIGMIVYHDEQGALPAAFTHQWSPQSLRGVNEACAVWPGQIRLGLGGFGAEAVFYCPEAPASSRWVPKLGGSNPSRYGYEAGEYYVPGAAPLGNSYGHNNNGTRTHAPSKSCGREAQFLGLSDDPDPGSTHTFNIPMSCVTRPSEFLCFADSKLDGVWDAFVDYQVEGEDLSHRHGGKCNFLFADGQVMTIPDPEAYEDNAVCRCLAVEKGRVWNNDNQYP